MAKEKELRLHLPVFINTRFRDLLFIVITPKERGWLPMASPTQSKSTPGYKAPRASSLTRR